MKVISGNNERHYIPITGLITFWLLLDRWRVPGWAWGVYWTLAVFVVGGSIWLVFKQEQVDIFKRGEDGKVR